MNNFVDINDIVLPSGPFVGRGYAEEIQPELEKEFAEIGFRYLIKSRLYTFKGKKEFRAENKWTMFTLTKQLWVLFESETDMVKYRLLYDY